MKKILKNIGICAGVIGISLLAIRGCNMAWDHGAIYKHRTIDKPAYHMESYPTGLTGHIEYTKYSDGSQDVKEYSRLWYRKFDSELHQDLDGNNLVDRIRQNVAGSKVDKTSEILVREYDYESNKEKFDEADKKLQKLSEKYSK